MCGIVGVRSNVGAAATAQRMLAKIAHRGPDGLVTQTLDDGRWALGHARLAIIDISPSGTQPMRLHGTDLWITYNGEIYNYRALRRELEASGRTFHTHSDTEVLLAGYAEWGDRLLERLDGIFAFGLWDGARRRLWLVRDHLGVKPMYYLRDARRFAFASEPKALLEASDHGPQADHAAIHDFLTFGYVPGSRSAFAAIEKLPAAHALFWEDERIRTYRYWNARDYATGSVDDERAAIAETLTLLDDATEAQLESDVPVGMLVSGGIDSSAVASSVALRHPHMDGFVIGFEQAAFDERGYARALATQCGIALHERVVSARAGEGLIERMTAAYDEPFADSSTLPSLALFGLVRDHGLKVVLGGDGGDELFGGYRRYDRFVAAEGLSQLRWPWKLRGARGIRQALSIAAHPARYRRPAWRAYYERLRIFSFEEQQRILQPEWRPASEEALTRHFETHWDPALDTMKAAQLFDIETYLPEDILMKVDRAAMHVGVEARVPLLSRRMVEHALRISTAIQRRDGRRKYVLKRAIDGRVPPSLLTNRKRGFSLPLEATVGDTLRAWVARLEESAIVRDGIIAAELTPSSIQDLDKLWTLYTLDHWWSRWIAGRAVATPA